MERNIPLALWRTLILAQHNDHSSLPQLGLPPEMFKRIAVEVGLTSINQPKKELQQLYQTLMQARKEEHRDLIALLDSHKQKSLIYADEMVTVMASACMMPSHLWQILGFDTREQLGTLIATYFPTLHQQNHLNMRWKRFFYKQLCEQEGDYVCKAPNCLQCASFSECFAA
ncbi:nitrogen fixation protein NifQ [Vibrio sp. FNV 38]|nr:nitrogen fixation protein NifQ [Vibrio sp. FNV 38]